MNYIPFIAIAWLAYVATSNAESTPEASIPSTTPGVKTLSDPASTPTSAKPSSKTSVKHVTKKIDRLGPHRKRQSHQKSKSQRKSESHRKSSSHRKSESQRKLAPERRRSDGWSSLRNTEHRTPSGFELIMNNETALKDYTDCFLDRAPCFSEVASQIKARLAQDIRERCVVCTPVQYSNGKLYLEHISLHHPADYSLFLQKYDPLSMMDHFVRAAPLLDPEIHDDNSTQILFF